MENNNLNNIKEQIRNVYDNILNLQLPEKEDNSLYIQKLDTLLSNVQEIITQNKQIITQNEKTHSLLEKLIEKQKEVVIENSKKERAEPVNIKEEEPLDIFVLPEENLENIKQEEPQQEKVKPQQKVEAKPQQKEIKQALPPEPKQEKETSSVLEFLHKRVIKDNPSKTIADVKGKEQKSESVTSTLNSLFADSENENTETKQEKPATLFDNKEEKVEVLSDKQESIGDRFFSQTKNDLRVAIGINYKFMFINDLFSGDIKEYENFINQLNEMTSFTASMDIINQKRLVYKWAATSPAYANLVDIIQKRFE